MPYKKCPNCDADVLEIVTYIERKVIVIDAISLNEHQKHIIANSKPCVMLPGMTRHICNRKQVIEQKKTKKKKIIIDDGGLF